MESFLLKCLAVILKDDPKLRHDLWRGLWGAYLEYRYYILGGIVVIVMLGWLGFFLEWWEKRKQKPEDEETE